MNIVELKLEPIYNNDVKCWYVNKKLHRVDGPALIWPNGDVAWYQDGVLHREDGPAIECSDGSKVYAIRGIFYTKSVYDLIASSSSVYVKSPIRVKVDIGNGFKYQHLNGLISYKKNKYLWFGEHKLTEKEYEQKNAEWISISNKSLKYKNHAGLLHRIDGPAYIRPDGYKEWWILGNRHRLVYPAVEYPDGSKLWYKNNLLHREDGPAVESHDGTKEWWNHGKLHREDGPAVIKPDGIIEYYLNNCRHTVEEFLKTINFVPKWYHKDIFRKDGTLIRYTETKINTHMKDIFKDGILCAHEDGEDHLWYQDGSLHREDGPAIERKIGKAWYIKGELHRLDGPAIEYAGGDKYWYQNGHRHRENGPAIEYAGGDKEWYQNGKMHREDGPAFIRKDGYKEWWVKGKMHRLDGPARELKDFKEYWINNKQSSLEDYLLYLKNNSDSKNLTTDNESGFKKLAIDSEPAFKKPTIDTEFYKFWKNDKGEYHREDGPAREWANGTKEWWFDGSLHRTDGPARETPDGDKEWWFKGELHREDGPAFIEHDGTKCWFIHGKLQKTESPNGNINLFVDSSKKN